MPEPRYKPGDIVVIRTNGYTARFGYAGRYCRVVAVNGNDASLELVLLQGEGGGGGFIGTYEPEHVYRVKALKERTA